MIGAGQAIGQPGCCHHLLGYAGKKGRFCRKPPAGKLGWGGVAAGPLGPFGQGGKKREESGLSPREREEGFSLFFLKKSVFYFVSKFFCILELI
jgi:hypothetical protein